MVAAVGRRLAGGKEPACERKETGMVHARRHKDTVVFAPTCQVLVPTTVA